MPNGEDKKNNFVTKIRDPKTNKFRPVYVAPDATDAVQGDVKLSDSVSSTATAATGMTAATPKAVKTAYDKAVTAQSTADSANTAAGKKLDKTVTTAQTVAGPVTFSKTITGSVSGNAGTATKLATARNIKLTGEVTGSASFNGSADASIAATANITYAAGATKGGNAKIANDLVTQAAITASKDWNTLTATGQYPVAMATLAGTNIPTGAYGYGTLLVFHNSSNYTIQLYCPHQANAILWYRFYFPSTWCAWSKVGYTEIKDGSITTAKLADGAVTKAKLAANSVDASKIVDGSITSAEIADGAVTSADVGFNYAGSSSKGGKATSAATADTATKATSADKLTTARAISLIGNVTGSASFNGSANASISTTIANDSVSLAKLASDVGTVYVGSSQPTDPNIKLWIKT